MINYESLEHEYKRCIEASGEPNLMRIRLIKSTKAVRRKVGRWVCRERLQRGTVAWVFMKNKSGALVI